MPEKKTASASLQGPGGSSVAGFSLHEESMVPRIQFWISNRRPPPHPKRITLVSKTTTDTTVDVDLSFWPHAAHVCVHVVRSRTRWCRQNASLATARWRRRLAWSRSRGASLRRIGPPMETYRRVQTRQYKEKEGPLAGKIFCLCPKKCRFLFVRILEFLHPPSPPPRVFCHA